jgi:ATP-dependent DNA helicase RecG
VCHDHDRVVVTIYKNIVKQDIINFVAKADETFHLTQKERVTLGLLAQHEALTIGQLTKRLELENADQVKDWLGRLIKWELVKKKGRTKGTEYLVEPELLRRLNFTGPTSLKNIERHRLRALIMQDMEIYREASLGDIHHRIGPEISYRAVRHELQKLIEDGEIERQGANKGAKYLLTKRN